MAGVMAHTDSVWWPLQHVSAPCLPFSHTPTLVVRAQLASQVEEVKAQAEAAAEVTRKDIEKLRGLHKKRVSKLEALLKEEGERLAEARREIGTCQASRIRGDGGGEGGVSSSVLFWRAICLQKRV